ncbi:alginate lyase family protein [Dickeya sp. CFBP 2040]|uniref:alginate lyase family protein n=1 Tax=Dickeya sp. CFBP 2040 TaxID=2718531 RepID=UPI00144706D0|nr:alginate lyase family protein [Dickeya sp. CFBP 2040]NKI76134.1 alginate lyase family protein [Dickeya sp. CFBP 2040]
MRYGIAFLMTFALWGLVVSAGVASVRSDNFAYVFLQMDKLIQVKQQLRTQTAPPQMQLAYQQLLQAADNAMKKADLAVTQKLSIPPGGNRHDYLSLAAYWWPDPRKKDGLPWVRHDGKVNPATKGEQTDAIRLTTFTDRVRVLALAWYFSDRPEYAGKAISMIRTWFLAPETRMNPNLNYAQAIPGRNDGRGAGVLDGRFFATRIVDALVMLRQAPGWGVSDEQQMRQWMTEYLHWLLTSPNGRQEATAKNNHGSWYAVQVAGIAAYLGQLETVKAMVALQRQKLDHQLAVDGSQPEELARTRSFHYSGFNLQAVSLMATVAGMYGDNLWRYRTSQGSSLLSALDFMASYLDESRPWPYKAMGRERRESSSLIPLMLQAERAIGASRYQVVIRQAGFAPLLNGVSEGKTGVNISVDTRRSIWLLSPPASAGVMAIP